MTKVKGHYRKTSKGRRTWVKSHTRGNPTKTLKRISKLPYDIIEDEKYLYGFRDAGGRLVGDPVTVVQDAMGSLHIWEGIQDVQQTGKYTFEAAGKEAEHLLQVDYDIEEFLRQLPEEAKEEIEGGYTTYVTQMWF